MTDKEKLAELIYNNSPRLVEEEAEILASQLIAHGVTVLPESGIGDMSDGYHTFNELYHHRAVLFSVICNLHPLCAWKAKKHHDGSMYDGMFIVGINTPEGQATYHYDIDPYWDMFHVPEAEFAPEWDGHTPDEAIRRIGLLGTDCPVQRWIPVTERLPKNGERVLAHLNSGSTYIADFDNSGVFPDWHKPNSNRLYCYVTHWMPMPQPPKGE
jgi:hypothetical protein